MKLSVWWWHFELWCTKYSIFVLIPWGRDPEAFKQIFTCLSRRDLLWCKNTDLGLRNVRDAWEVGRRWLRGKNSLLIQWGVQRKRNPLARKAGRGKSHRKSQVTGRRRIAFALKNLMGGKKIYESFHKEVISYKTRILSRASQGSGAW